jgi:hypothetical protein
MRPTRRRPVVGLILAGVAVALAVTGCSASDRDDAGSTAADAGPANAEPAAPQDNAAEGGQAQGGGRAQGGCQAQGGDPAQGGGADQG